MINKIKLCYVLRSHYPEAFGIRKALQRKKVERLSRHILPEKLIRQGEEKPETKKEIIQPYFLKWQSYLQPSIKEMESILERAPQYATRTDKDVLRADMIFCRLAYGFIPSEYVGFNLEGRTPEERRTFCSDIDMGIFGYSVNNIRTIQTFLDKADGFRKFAKYYNRDAVVIEKESDYEAFLSFIKKHPVFVKKVVISSMGQGVELVKIDEQKTPKSYFESMLKQGKVLLEEKVVQNAYMAQLNESSVNTVRCMTFQTNQGIIVPYCFLKAGRNGAFVDNAGAGGIVIGIDPQNGVGITDGFTEYGERFWEHPETHVVFKGFQLPDWDRLVSLCKEITAQCPDMRYLSFDLAYTDHGWIVIEINEVGQFIIPQTVFQRGIKKELEDYLSKMEKAY